MRATLIVGTVVIALAGSEVFEGRLESKLANQPNPRWCVESVLPAIPEQRAKLPLALKERDLVWMKDIPWKSQDNKRAVVIVDGSDARKLLFVDANGDGKIAFSASSPESAFARDETIMFRVGDLYLSTEHVDLQNLRFTMRSHPASDYTRIELVPGTRVPDFRFVDLAGHARHLADFRGKYLLLDFWGSWCPPCVADLPHLQAVFEKYRDKGFEILGMTNDENVKAAEKVLGQHGCQWTNALPDGVKELIEKRFRNGAYPTMVLLDPNGRIHSLGEGLKGTQLEETL